MLNRTNKQTNKQIDGVLGSSAPTTIQQEQKGNGEGARYLQADGMLVVVGGGGRAGRRPSPACDAMAMEVTMSGGGERRKRGIFRKQAASSEGGRGPQDRGRGSGSHQLGLRPVRGQRAHRHPYPLSRGRERRHVGTSIYRTCISGSF